jgi:hypothetical protein
MPGVRAIVDCLAAEIPKKTGRESKCVPVEAAVVNGAVFPAATA